MKNDTITAIDGISVGHAALREAPSGCTVVLTGRGAVAGVDVRGGAPGTYGTDALNPLNLVDRVHGLFLTGGSAFGLSVADGVRRYLGERGLGFDTGHGLVPIIAGAVIFDLGVNGTGNYPDSELGYLGCVRASNAPVPEGCVGAGIGATVGKLYGLERAMKGGLGSECVEASSGLKVAALMVVNAFGDIVDPALGRPVAGCRGSSASRELIDMDAEICRLESLKSLEGFPSGQNTVIGIVATNAKLNKTQLTKVAQMAHDGLARTVYPAHTLYDGDTIFALSCGELEGVEVTMAGALAARATAGAILRAVRKATDLGSIPACGRL
jgi:L-aminopeptidase/D-esterase-like protein